MVQEELELDDVSDEQMPPLQLIDDSHCVLSVQEAPVPPQVLNVALGSTVAEQ